MVRTCGYTEDRSGIMTEACSEDHHYVSSESCGDRVDITDHTSVEVGLSLSREEKCLWKQGRSEDLKF